MINIINNIEPKRLITNNPHELVESIQKYQSKIMYLVFTKEIDIKNVVFSNIGYGE